ncbi:S8 family serine peptidase [Thermoactinospora rubra]|uniref:S8 family serine peptidase n=1 Tax=Thermoactinospora rubra TaxID=1088767 RepID=UPI001301E43D|nr:S8 family serine peptidase [Thermoactinospora rubra]
MSPLPIVVLWALVAGATPPGTLTPAADDVDDVDRVDKVAATVRARQWHLGALRLPEAWRLSKGEGVLVAVLDTGVDRRHPDLRGAVIHGPDLTGSRRGRSGHHGTAMASLIAGRGHGEDGRHGVMGVAPRARILSVKVTLDSGDPVRELLSARSGEAQALARGIRYAVDSGADVINMSLGGGSGTWRGSPAELEAVRYALDRGAVLVASSGNDGQSTNRRTYPAAYPGVIAVGAVDRALRVPAFSNRQDYLSVVAPGTRIVGADGSSSYVIGDGTSPAAAMVAGVAALIKARHPGLTPQQVRGAIERGTRKRPAAGHSRAYGHGVVDALKALKEAERIAHARPARLPLAKQPPYSRLPVIVAMVLLAAVMSARVLARR